MAENGVIGLTVNSGSPTAPAVGYEKLWVDSDRSIHVKDSDGVENATRTKLLANTTYYVRTDGNDSNTGLVDSSSGALLTLQAAVNKIQELDLNRKTAYIYVRAGTYTAGASFNRPFTGLGSISVIGDTTTPSNVTISTTSSNCFILNNMALGVSISGFKVVTTTANCIQLYNGSQLYITGNMDFGNCGNSHLSCEAGSRLFIDGISYTISGSAAYHMTSLWNSYLSNTYNTVTISGSPNFSQRFVDCYGAAVVKSAGNTYSGSATGTRYSASYNGIIYVYGGGANYFPGNSAGATSTGGQYG